MVTAAGRLRTGIAAAASAAALVVAEMPGNAETLSAMDAPAAIPQSAPLPALPPLQALDPQDALAPAARLKSSIDEAWADATRTWAGLMGQDVYDSDPPRINFVPEVKATHCYGLYISAGPVYCSGNNTIFVSIEEMQRLETKLPGFGDGGLALLVAHELGHHVQKITGRFRLLSGLMRSDPAAARDLLRRFELEADCLAGIWAAHSHSPLATGSEQATLAAAAESIGDDRVKLAGETPSDPAMFTHGTALQRRHWFETGLRAPDLDACNVLQAPAY